MEIYSIGYIVSMIVMCLFCKMFDGKLEDNFFDIMLLSFTSWAGAIIAIAIMGACFIMMIIEEIEYRIKR